MVLYRKYIFESFKIYPKFSRYYSTYSSFTIKPKFNSDQIYDFRSDTVTRPTDEMFDIMRNASRDDDVHDVNIYKFFLQL
jgi:hypothetical protein